MAFGCDLTCLIFTLGWHFLQFPCCSRMLKKYFISTPIPYGLIVGVYPISQTIMLLRMEFFIIFSYYFYIYIIYIALHS